MPNLSESTSPDTISKLRMVRQMCVTLANNLEPVAIFDSLLELGLELAEADCGYLLKLGKGRLLQCHAWRCNSLELTLEGYAAHSLTQPIPLFLANRAPNHAVPESWVVLNGAALNLADRNHAPDFDFAAIREFDRRHGYRSRAVLMVPLQDHTSEAVGVLVLINPTITPAFSETGQLLVEHLATQAAIAYSTKRLNHTLDQIGLALTQPVETNRLMEVILESAQTLTRADAGTLYRVTPDQRLKFEILRNDSLNLVRGGTSGIPVGLPDIPLYHADGSQNLGMVAAYSVLMNRTVNIPDAYEAEGFDFSGTRRFDEQTGYRSKSFLTVPLQNHEQEVIAVLQLINARNPVTDQIRTFDQRDQLLAGSMASLAAIALTNQTLIGDLKGLFEAFIRAIASAIDDKSPYTGSHCYRVPVIAELLAKEACTAAHGELKDFNLDSDQMYELRVAAWLHDCGKVITPLHVVDKATKLETIFDRITLISQRFSLLEKQEEANYLQQRLAYYEATTPPRLPMEELQQQWQARVDSLRKDLEFVRGCNIGSEFMSQERQIRLREIAKQTYRDHLGNEQPLITADELYNLNIVRGTINREEREIINEHVSATTRMLRQLPFPKIMRRVPEIAGNHHEQCNGRGYPHGLFRDEMCIQSRILAIADVFEAITAKDRPYKKGNTLSEALRILGHMKLDGHIDPDLFQVFIDREIYLTYANAYLAPEQLDTIDLTKIPGYTPPSASS